MKCHCLKMSHPSMSILVANLRKVGSPNEATDLEAARTHGKEASQLNKDVVDLWNAGTFAGRSGPVLYRLEFTVVVRHGCVYLWNKPLNLLSGLTSQKTDTRKPHIPAFEAKICYFRLVQRFRSWRYTEERLLWCHPVRFPLVDPISLRIIWAGGYEIGWLWYHIRF